MKTRVVRARAGKVDAIFGWDAFENIWPKTSEAVELPYEFQVFRSTGVAVLDYSKSRELAGKFIDFLVSDEGRKVYEEYGWIQTRLGEFNYSV